MHKLLSMECLHAHVSLVVEVVSDPNCLTIKVTEVKDNERKHKASADEIEVVHGRLKKGSEMNTGYKVK
ncbi:MAG: hypothetical protein WC855_01110 [Thermodesulfovibrionales bacterium]